MAFFRLWTHIIKNIFYDEWKDIKKSWKKYKQVLKGFFYYKTESNREILLISMSKETQAKFFGELSPSL